MFAIIVSAVFTSPPRLKAAPNSAGFVHLNIFLDSKPLKEAILPSRLHSGIVGPNLAPIAQPDRATDF